MRSRCSGPPAASRIGTGQALVRSSGFFNQDIRATLDVFLADRVQSADVASAVVVVRALGISRAVRTRPLAHPTGPFGYEPRPPCRQCLA